MSLPDPRTIFGVHSVTPYNRTTGKFYGTLRVIKGSTLSLTGTGVDLMGGDSKFPFAVEDGEMKSEMSLKFAEYADFLFTLFLGVTPTANAAEAAGAIGTLTNKSGTLVAASGLASVGLVSGSKADVKLAKYVVVAVTTTTVDVYAASDIDFARGTSVSFQDATLKITPTPLTITMGGNTPIPGTGAQLVGGASAIAMNAGDTATFWTRPVNTGSMIVKVGATANQVMPEFGCIALAAKRGNGEMTEVDVFRCKGSGMPIGFDPNAWSQAEVKVNVFYDSAKDGVFEFRNVQGA